MTLAEKNQGRLISVDPGLRACGGAVFQDGVLIRAGLIRNPVKTDRGMGSWRAMAKAVEQWADPAACDLFVSESMQIYRGADVNPANLMELVGVTGAMCRGVEAKGYIEFIPRIWKKQIPQREMERIVDGILTPEERATYEPCAAGLLHNVAHGVGLGLYFLGRFDPSKY